MEESQIPSGVETPSAPVTSTSLSSKLMDVFIAPGEVFENVKSTPEKAVNWLVPMVIVLIASVIAVLVIYSQPAIVQSITNAQHQRVQEMVDKGKLTQQQADQAEERTSNLMGPSFLKISGSVGAAFLTPAKLFVGALVLWLIGRFALHGHFTYMKAAEVVGLAMMISALGALVQMVLVCLKGNVMANLGPSLFVSNLDQTKSLGIALASINLMTFWELAVLSIGLGKLSGTGWVKPAIWLFGIWAFLTAAGIAIAALFR